MTDKCSCETILERLAGHEPHKSSASSITDDLTRFGKRFTSMLVNIARVWPPEYIPLVHPIVSLSDSCRLRAMSRALTVILRRPLAPPDWWSSFPPEVES